MRDNVHFRGINFDSDFRHAVRDDGLTRKFTRSERLLVRELVRHGGAVVSRDRLLDALSGEGSDASDRNIDFIINRLRRKLSDPARSPEFIATHYGEGYSWIAPAFAKRPVCAGAFIVIGPLRGLHHVSNHKKQAHAFARELHLCLKGKVAVERTVVLDPDCPPVGAFDGGAPEYAVELNFITAGDALNCIMTLTAFRTGQILHVARRTLLADNSPAHELRQTVATAVCEEFGDAIWAALATNETSLKAPTSEPLFLRMKEAAHVFVSEKERWQGIAQQGFWTKKETWQENEGRLRRILQENPDDPVAGLMLAANIHAKWVLSGHQLIIGSDTRREDEDEMERLLTAGLPIYQGSPELCLMAAKLLFFLDRGYRRLAVEMAERAFQETTALATSLAFVGQMRLYLGEIEEGLEFLDRAEELTEEGSQFWSYLICIKISGYLASGDHQQLREKLEYVFRVLPVLKPFLSVACIPDASDPISPETEIILSQMGTAQAQALLLYNNYIFARHFSLQEHRENLMRGLVTLLGRRFGYDVIPDEVRKAIPSLIPVSA